MASEESEIRVATDNLDPNISMMDATKDQSRHDIAQRLRASEKLTVLIQRYLYADRVVV